MAFDNRNSRKVFRNASARGSTSIQLCLLGTYELLPKRPRRLALCREIRGTRATHLTDLSPLIESRPSAYAPSTSGASRSLLEDRWRREIWLRSRLRLPPHLSFE